jgi:flagellar capping protein FliD
MTTIPSTTMAATTAAYGATVTSLAARNAGLQGLDVQIRRDDARLSTLGRLANVLDDVKSVAGALAASGLKLVSQVDGKALDARITAAGAAAGTHKVDVKQLAQAQQLVTVQVPAASTTIDEAKLNAAIAAAPDDVARVFANGGAGLADKVGAGIARQLANGGTIATQAAAVTKEHDALAGRKTQLAQASALARQYANGARPPSAFDFLA